MACVQDSSLIPQSLRESHLIINLWLMVRWLSFGSIANQTLAMYITNRGINFIKPKLDWVSCIVNYIEMWRRSANFQEQIFHKLLSRFLQIWCVYMKGIKYMNLVQISSVVIKTQRVDNGDLVVPINNTLVCSISFLVADMCLYANTLVHACTNEVVMEVSTDVL